VAPARDMSAPNTAPWLGDGADLSDLIDRRKVDTVIVSSSMECWNRYLQSLILARNRGVEIVDLASVCERFLNRIPCDQITEMWLLWGLMGRSSLYVTRLKRLVDFTLASASFVVLLPLFAIVWIAIRLSSAGPVFYRQERIGLNNRPFSVVKFRSMVHGAEDASGPVWATEADPRVTPLGAAAVLERDPRRHEPRRAPPGAERIRQRVPHRRADVQPAARSAAGHHRLGADPLRLRRVAAADAREARIRSLLRQERVVPARPRDSASHDENARRGPRKVAPRVGARRL
jgi:hypothetical protein